MQTPSPSNSLTDPPLRDAWIEVDLDRIAANTRAIKAMCGPNTSLGAVVKANAYGHGADAICDTLLENGASMLLVATLSEALALKQAHPYAEVLIMGLTPTRCFPDLLRYDIIQTIDRVEQAEALSALSASAGKAARVHLKLDTGFHRIGFPDTEDGCRAITRCLNLPYLQVEGIFTHLVLLNDDTSEAQFAAFLRLKEQLSAQGFRIPCWHIADSIASVDYPQMRMDMIRAGAILYGLKGFHKGRLPIRQALRLKARITHISALEPGEGVSYDFTWKAPRKTRVATLPLGYADGYPRNLSGKAEVLVRGKRVPVAGLICMDQMMIDLGDVPDAEVGDEVLLYGDGTDGAPDIPEIASLSGTNKNDIVSRLSPRLPRLYRKSGRALVQGTAPLPETHA